MARYDYNIVFGAETPEQHAKAMKEASLPDSKYHEVPIAFFIPLRVDGHMEQVIENGMRAIADELGPLIDKAMAKGDH